MEPQTQQLFTTKHSQLFQAGPYSVWLGWMEPFEMLQLLAIPLCRMALHLLGVCLQQAKCWHHMGCCYSSLVQSGAPAV